MKWYLSYQETIPILFKVNEIKAMKIIYIRERILIKITIMYIYTYCNDLCKLE